MSARVQNRLSADPVSDFILHQVPPGSICLDYGCGEGQLVADGLSAGLDFWGAENYYNGKDWSHAMARTPPELRTRIKSLGENFRIPFDDGTFDFVSSIQVIEHVSDLDRTVEELARVTKIGAINIHNFPTSERVREAHLGVPYFHRVPASARRHWSRLWYRTPLALRFGINDFNEWYTVRNRFYEELVHLRSFRTVEDAFGRYFDLVPIEIEKLGFHLGRRLPQSRILRHLERRRVGATIRMIRRRD